MATIKEYKDIKRQMYVIVRKILDARDRRNAKKAPEHLKEKILRNIVIRREVFNGLSYEEVGRRHGISRSRVSAIVGKNFRWIENAYVNYVRRRDKDFRDKSCDQILYGEGGPYEGVFDEN